MLVNIFMNCRHKDEIFFAFAGLCAVFAGIINGLIGTGGGVVIFYILKKLYGADTKKAFSSVMATVLPMTLLSALIYERSGAGAFYLSLPYLLPAALGGLSGAMLFERIKTGTLKTAFSLMLAVSGALMLIK